MALILLQIKKHKFLLLFFLITLGYALLYGPYGYDDADGGYTLALSWRIMNGEIPYKDFIIVRPPLSPIFHSLFFYIIPENFQLIFDRFLCYALFASASLFGALTIKLKFSEINIQVFLLASLGFVFSIVNFPPMAWHTVDGIFFASLGVYVLTRYTDYLSIAFGIMFLFFSAICKQPFYLIPVGGILYVALLTRDVKKTILAIVCLMIFLAFFFYILYFFNILTSFLTQTSGSTNIQDLLVAGFFNYLSVGELYVLLPIAFWILVRRPFSFWKVEVGPRWVPYMFMTLILILPMIIFLKAVFTQNDPYLQVYEHTTAIILFIITSLLILENIFNESKWITLTFLLLISWCASISWGYRTPVMFSLPLVFGFLTIARLYFDTKNLNRLAFSTLIVAMATYFVAYQKPYWNPLRSNLVYSNSTIFSKFSYIKVGKATHEKYTEFANLVKRYGSNFKTLPGMPLANYLTNTKSPIKLDWVFNAETLDQNQNIISELKRKKTFIFLEKATAPIYVTANHDKYTSSVAYEIKMTWNKIDSTRYFEIYFPF